MVTLNMNFEDGKDTDGKVINKPISMLVDGFARIMIFKENYELEGVYEGEINDGKAVGFGRYIEAIGDSSTHAKSFTGFFNE